MVPSQVAGAEMPHDIAAPKHIQWIEVPHSRLTKDSPRLAVVVE